MIDSTKMVPKGHHFCSWDRHDGVRKKFRWKTRWSVKPVAYFIIDFVLSTRCASKDALVSGRKAHDKSVPEFLEKNPYNPFMGDVYHFGNVLVRSMKVRLTVGTPFL